MSVEDANRLTAAWAATLGDDASTVLSGAGAYPLLALLATAAAGPAAEELRSVAPGPLELPPAVQAAIGLWPRADVSLTPQWRHLIAGVLTDDRAPLDRWASEQTGGEIPTMPIQITRDTRLVLAAALAVATTWADPFVDGPMTIETGPWSGHRINALHREAPDLAGITVADTAAGRVTLVTVAGADDLDVVLALGEPALPPSTVLPAAITAHTTAAPPPDSAGAAPPARSADTATLSTNGSPATPGGRSASAATGLRIDGPGITIERSLRPGVELAVPRFSVRADHDLLRHAEVFGLRTASDKDHGHFPGIAPEPLAIGAAAQAATATFSARGFRAAAVTAFAVAAGAALSLDYERVLVTIDRPFGFLAVHRPTGLVLFAGWVADPEPWTAPTWGEEEAWDQDED